MPLQNRVAPNGELHQVPQRGTMMGNRGGKFHRDDRTLSKRRWASHHWIACDLHFKNAHHDAMGQGYTSLFFLDEVTALAAGHRPCFYCRREEAKNFAASWPNVDALDRLLHRERQSPPPNVEITELVDAAMVQIDDQFFAKRGKQLLRWSFAGYTSVVHIGPAMRAKLLTPPTITAILAQGYQPRWHASALQWDTT